MNSLYKKANPYPLAGPHHLWAKNKQAIKTELEGLGHWADKVVWVQKPADVDDNALAFVSDKDWDGNGKPDNIYIITNKIQSKEDVVFIAEVADAIRHEVDHIEKGRRIEGVDGGPATYEFSPEHSAESAEVGIQEQVDKMMAANNSTYYSNSMSAAARFSIMRSLIKISNSLDKKGFFKEADMIDGIITKVHGKGPEESVELTEEEIAMLDKEQLLTERE